MSLEGENRSLVWIHDANNPRVMAAIHNNRCHICGAGKGEPCRNTINKGDELPGRAIHFERDNGDG